jgi:folate-binding protein YgfZ
MYVLRAKVRITENSPWLLLGLGGRAAAHGLSRLGQQAPQPMQVIQTPEFGVDRVIGLPAITPPALAMAPNVEAATRDSATPWPAGGGELHDSNSPIARSLLIVQQSAIVETWRILTIDLTPVATGAWRFLEVLSGIPRIVAGAVDQFVPQMINLERVEGVNFRKGCYPGQEVVARSQYLGKLKRRMFLARAAGAQALPGADVYVTGRTEPAGMVVLAAMAAPGTQVILYEAPRDLVEEHIGQGGLRLHSVEGEVLQALALPYDL